MPLHNLTSNDYKIRIDVPMIWMEFTKLSSNSDWRPDYVKSAGRTGVYLPFDKQKLDQKKTLSNYINDANPNGPVVSTILGFFDEIGKKVSEGERKISEATSGVATATRAFNIAVIVAMLGITVTIGVTIFQTANLNNKTTDYLNNSSNQIQRLQENLSNTSNTIHELQESLKKSANSNGIGSAAAKKK